MDYLRLFRIETEYNTSKSEFEYPTVSYVTDADIVHYMEKPHDYSKDYLTFEALESGVFTITIPAAVNSSYMTSISYSVDDGEKWTTTTVDNTRQTITTPTINAGDKVLWKGEGIRMAYEDSNNSKFSSTGNFNASGNIMSLLYGDNFAKKTSFASGSSYNFCKLFYGCTKLISTGNLILSALTLTENCYRTMFQTCTLLTTAPTLPATTLANSCYSSMFQNCTSLTTAPELPATTLANACYGYMFASCFSLKTAPELPATTLVDQCYYGMFHGCISLNRIKMLATDISATNCLNIWVNGVASTGTFVKNSAATWNVTGVNGIPNGWTVETASA